MLSFKTIDKDFGATRAVINVTLDAEPGVVLGLVGENGAGKSTLIKIAGGIVRQDRGVVSLDGEAMVGLGPAKAIARGIVSVFQELTLVRSLTVAENLFLSAPPRRAWASIDRRKLEADAQALLDGYDVRRLSDRRRRQHAARPAADGGDRPRRASQAARPPSR